jgi:tRNA nucleotidyltransferase (CCA-adding enzyme)
VTSETEGLQVYKVGGAVRDQLLGYPSHETDWVVVGATGAELLARNFKQVGKDFPVFLHPRTCEEYALARTERKSGHGYHGFDLNAEPTVTLEEDLQRRDLTINAMAMDASGTLIDPWGGRADLDARLLRHVSPAFAEDPLRVLRVARFAARYHQFGFTIAPETFALMREVVAAGELEYLSVERIWMETERALGGPSPTVYLECLNDCGALNRIAPGINEEALTTLRRTEDRLNSSLERWAALLSPLDNPAIERVNAALKTPKAFRDLACHVASWAHDIDLLEAKAVLTALTRCQALKKPDAFEMLITTLAALESASGKSGHIAAFMRAARDAIADVQAQPLIAEGYAGEALGRAIEQARLNNLSTVIDDSLRPSH